MTDKSTIAYYLQRGNNNLDFVRVICAMVVIAGHSYKMLPLHGHQEPLHAFVGFTHMASLAVKIFFFISGMLVTNSLLEQRSVIAFVVSRIFRVMPGLLLVLLVTSFVIGPLVTHLPPNKYFSVPQVYSYVYKNLLFQTQYYLPGVFENNTWPRYVNASLWTLRIEVKCYLLLLMLYILARGRRVLYNLFVLLVVTDALLQLRIIGVGQTSILNLLPFSFALGVFVAVNKERLRFNNLLPCLLLAVTMVLWHVPHINEMMLIVSSCVLVVLASQNEYVQKIAIKHDISYGMYIWSFVVQQTIICIGGAHQNLYVYMLQSILLSCIMGYVSYLTVEHRAISYGKKLRATLMKKQYEKHISFFAKW
jgi:peptidoglycan/LPS O-acetylase OafA/YrhL